MLLRSWEAVGRNLNVAECRGLCAFDLNAMKLSVRVGIVEIPAWGFSNCTAVNVIA
jgi:hypothetical protein